MYRYSTFFEFKATANRWLVARLIRLRAEVDVVRRGTQLVLVGLDHSIEHPAVLASVLQRVGRDSHVLGVQAEKAADTDNVGVDRPLVVGPRMTALRVAGTSRSSMPPDRSSGTPDA